ncbi:MAG: hypothetical protein J7M29_03220 [Verrucomicrobia bacterium]|nr:hypothetical protein [Verrucomicrobiota bacterium]
MNPESAGSPPGKTRRWLASESASTVNRVGPGKGGFTGAAPSLAVSLEIPFERFSEQA